MKRVYFEWCQRVTPLILERIRGQPLSGPGASFVLHGMSPRLIRFVLLRRHPDTGVAEGILRLAYDLRDSDDVPAYERANLRVALAWLGEHLPVPSRFGRTQSDRTRGISWFKCTAREAITHVRDIGRVLDACGHPIVQVETRRPGYVVYEDEFQVVAEPFSSVR